MKRIALMGWVCLAAAPCSAAVGQAPPPQPAIRIVFLGDRGHHEPARRAAQLIPVLDARGIRCEYTEDPGVLSPERLRPYDGILIYANMERIEPEQERALLQFVRSGKGLIAVHCASYCFLNSEAYVKLVGAQFRRHGTGIVRPQIIAPDHPIMRGFGGMESWDETYEHHRHNEQGRTVLSVRDGEPWTWVRQEGLGRVFYTAWGHDHRTWGHPGFHNLLERGIRWATGRDPQVVPPYDPAARVAGVKLPAMKSLAPDRPPFQYRHQRIAYYPPGRPSRGDGTWDQMQLPLAPAGSMKHMVTPAGFHVRLFASEPHIRKPICMNWDTRGRLWIAESVDYPNDLQPPGQGHDRIVICEDTDGDGQADKFTVFADRLSIPTSMVFARGGVIVHQAPQTLFLADTDGDDRADVRQVLFEGWNTDDTHAGPSNLRYGLDNWIWGTVGYAGFRGRVGDQAHEFRQGIYRFRPDGSRLEFLRSTSNNTWGLGFSEEGLVFASTANRVPSVYMGIPNRYYERVYGWAPEVLASIADSHLFHPITDRIRQVDHHGGFTAGAGHALYTARTYPPLFWNRSAFVCGPTGHLVGVFLLRPCGAGWQDHCAFNLLASEDEWTAPIAAEVGPDGHVWVIDWYNYIVQHNPTPAGYRTGRGNAYETPLRDKTHGRIYRVVYEGAPPYEPLALSQERPGELVSTLKHPNMFWRLAAQRLLVERGKADVVPALLELVRDPSCDATGLNAGAIHGLWTLHGLGVIGEEDPEVFRAVVWALKHPSPGVRLNAARVLPHSVAARVELLRSGLLDDPAPAVRMAALLALADMPADRQAGAAVAHVLSQSVNLFDPWIRQAAIAAAASHASGFLTSLGMLAGEPVELTEEVVRLVSRHWASTRPGPGPLEEVLRSWMSVGGPVREAAVSGMVAGWPEDHRLPLSQPAEQAIARLFQAVPVTAQAALLPWAARVGSNVLAEQAEQLAETLLQQVADASRPAGTRVEAARQAVSLQGSRQEVLEAVLQQITPNADPRLAEQLLEALAQGDPALVTGLLWSRYRQWTPRLQRAAIGVALQRRALTPGLLQALADREVPVEDLLLDQKQQLLNHPDPALARRAREILAARQGVPDPDRAAVLQEYAGVARMPGDAGRGREVFRKHCSKCHRHGEEGTPVGPDLTGMAVHPKEELLVHILDPSRSVEGNYRSYSVALADGRVLSGMLAGETRTTLELVDAEGRRQVVRREEVDVLVNTGKSLMPEGFERQMSRQELADLLEFLTRPARFVPLDLRKVATIVSTRGMFYDENSPVERLIFSDWSVKTFQGIPFHLVDPQGDRVPNVIMLYGPRGKFPPRMPRSVQLPCNLPVRAIHMLSGISGWGAQGPRENGSVSLIVRLHFADGTVEEHPLRDGYHFADYIGRFDVPGSQFAFSLRRQQVRYLKIEPKRTDVVKTIELVKGDDHTAPIVMAMTVEVP